MARLSARRCLLFPLAAVWSWCSCHSSNPYPENLMNTIDRSRPALPVLALLTLLAIPAARAASYYVATTGLHTNPGTQAQPFKTIQKGINPGMNCDIIQIAAGTYFE